MARAISNVFKGTIFGAASLGLAFMMGGSTQQTYAQSAGDQCLLGLHQYADGLLRRFEPTGGTYLNIGSSVASQLQSGLDVADQDVVVNASGYNTLDGLIYSLVTDPIDSDDPEHNGQSGGLSNTGRPNYVRLVSTDPATGVVTEIGEPTQAGAPGNTLTQVLTNVQVWNGTQWNHSSFSMGDVFGGFLYAAVGGANEDDNRIYKIDVTTNTYEVIDVAYSAGIPGTVELSGDLVYLDGYLYTIEGAHTRDWPFPSRLVRIEVAAGTGEAVVVDSLPIQDRSYGSLWVTQDGAGNRLFAYDNSNGQVYEVFNFVSGTPATTPMTQMSAATNSDGISCVNAELTGFEATASDDVADTQTNVAAVVDWRTNDVGTTAFSMTAFDTASAQGGVVTNNGDGTFTYAPPVDFVGTDTFTYTICLDGVVPDVCDGATVSVSVTEPAPDPDDSNSSNDGQGTADDGGAVLGATTDDQAAQADGNGQVLGEGDVLAETGSPAQMMLAAGLTITAVALVVSFSSRSRIIYRL